MSEAVHVATIVATRGNRGEVAAVCPSGRPERLIDQPWVLLAAPGSAPTRRELRRAWVHRGRLILHFEGIETISAAEAFVGQQVLLGEDRLLPLPEGEYYAFQLQGLLIEDEEGRQLGEVTGLESAPGQDLLVVETPGGRLAHLPMSAALVLDIDLRSRRIKVRVPEGLLEGEPEVVVVEPVGHP